MAKTMEEMNITVSDGIAALTPYPPGKPIEELERELGIQGSIKLASNENPLGPSKKAVEAIARELTKLNRYPDGSCYYLKKRLAAFLKVSEDSLIIGNGSNEIIELLIRTFLKPGDEVLMGDPSFAVYPLVTQAAGGVSVKTPLNDLTIDMEALGDALTDKTRLVFISNPNNPTGTIVKGKELDAFIAKATKNAIIVIDEAYVEYVTDRDFPDSIKYLDSGKAVIILRTFSKIYGLAGLRVGYGIASPKIIDYLNRVRQPFNVNSLAQVAATAALDDTEHVERSRKTNSDGLQMLFTELERKGFVCVPTEANFFLVKVGRGDVVYNELLKKGVIVRPMKSYSLPEYIRVTVGTEAENRRFLEAFFKVME
ncbi:MAG: histidinol-phosphate transaminase [Deltaproteobacteria bacterium]|nr:histidinol-phosphate transaminase [Deltaproteobacteria bacterium]